MSNAGGKAPNGAAELDDEVFDRAPTPTVLVRADPDRAGRFFRTNQAMCALVGGGPEYLLAQNLAGFFDRPDRAAAAAMDGLLGGAPAGCEFEARFYRADGAARVAHVVGSPVSPGSGAPPYAIVQMHDVSDQRAADATQRQLASLVESSDDAIIGVTLTGTIMSWNRGAESLYGYTAGEAVGRPIFMLVPDDRMHEVPAFVPGIRRGQQVKRKETVRIAKDGTALDVSLTISPIAGPDGDVTGMAVIARDITRQKRIEAELRHTSRYFELSRDLVCTAGLDGRFRQLNGTWTEVLGWTEEELRSRPFVDFVHPDDREATIGETGRLAEGATTVGFINRYATRAGGWRWIDWNASTAPDEELVYATARDVTDRVIAEATQAASEARLRQILDVAQDAFIAMDAAGDITAWNPAAAATFGWTGPEALGRDLADTVLPVRHRGRHRAGVAHFLATGEGSVLGRRIEMSALHRDGHEFPVELTISAVPDGEGRSFNAFLRDISDRRQAQEQLVTARDQALDASVLKSQFLANMSHEIRTPMNGVLGMTELLLDTPLDGRQREFAETVHASGEALLTLINDILDLSKIEAGGLDLESIDFDLPGAIEDVAGLLATRAQAKGLELVIDIAGDVPAGVRGDPGRLRQVLTNLLGNAVKFTATGQVVVLARVVCRTGVEATLRVRVEDTGIGIDADKIARIFEPFAQADSSTTRRYGGTGLGLAITRQLVELMGGRCGVESEVGVGTTFWITLPLQLALGEVRPRATVIGAELAGTNVLVVDDNATNRAVLDGFLAGWGMNVVVVDSGAAALDAARAAVDGGVPFALVVSDMYMPGMSGLELSASLAADPATAAIPIVLLTSSIGNGDLGPARSARVAAHLTKPVRREALRSCLGQILTEPVRRGRRPRPHPWARRRRCEASCSWPRTT